MSSLKQFLETRPEALYSYCILVSVVLVVFLILSLRKLGLERIREIVYNAFVVAENHFNDGDEKFEYVVKVAQMNIPMPFKLVITEKTLRKTIQLWFDICKDLLDNGKIDNVENYTALK